MITKTIGSGGNYSSWETFYSYLIGISPISDNIQVDVVSGFEETAPSSEAHYEFGLNGYILTVNFNAYTITIPSDKSIYCYSPDSGTIIFNGGGSTVFKYGGFQVSTNDANSSFVCHDFKFRGDGSQNGPALLVYRSGDSLVYNLELSNFFGCLGNSSYSTEVPIGKKTFSNIVAYGGYIGVANPPSASNYDIEFINVGSFGNTFKDWYNNDPFVLYQNCGDSDNTLLNGSNSINNLVPVDSFTSIIYNETGFLKPNNSSIVRNAGVIPIGYTLDLDGNEYGAGGIYPIGPYMYTPSTSADFSGTPLSGYGGQSVQFSDQSTGTPTSWLWSFGDGYTSTEQNPSHTYVRSGYYTVSLTIGAGVDTSTETKTNYIHILSLGSSVVSEFLPAGLVHDNGPTIIFS